MTRSVDDLAADVRRGAQWRGDRSGRRAMDALGKLVALVGTLTQERDVAIEAAMQYRREREAAESALADMRRALEEIASAGWTTQESRDLIEQACRALAAAGPAPEEGQA